jgi:hypothetical protein
MLTDQRVALAKIRRFDQLIAYLRDELDWPIRSDDFEDLTFEYTPDELGIDPKNAAKIEEIRRLRPLTSGQPWGIFFVKFEPKRLPVVALRRILGQVALKKRASANVAERRAWAADDLLFVSNYGEGDERQISFAHFSSPQGGHDLPTLKVLGWDNLDTALHLDAVAKELTQNLSWPADETDIEAWRSRWSSAFTLRNREVIITSKELSIRLAELAKAIRDRIRTALAIETSRGPLTRLMKAFREALVHDLDPLRFADMYAQTIAYGLLSARIADPHKRTVDDFAGHLRTNPFLRELMEAFLEVGGRRGGPAGPDIDFDELGVSEVVQLLDDANMEAVVADFGDRNPEEDPVIHFYEDFLAAYDKDQKVSRGVFYTPRPVVSYIVRSLDAQLRTEFGLSDGLADTSTWAEMVRSHEGLKIPKGVSPDQDFVQILDPACGTGTFLVEAIALIFETVTTKWRTSGRQEPEIGPLWNEYVAVHLLPRLHGYELLMAPYAIAHLKIGLKLYETGYLFGSDQRAQVFLTNALEPAADLGQLTLEGFLPALAHEAEAVNEVKRRRRFTVVLGNPPYSNVGQLNRIPFILDLLNTYKEGLQEKKLNLDDDFIKFYRFSHYQLERAGIGCLGLITNNVYLDGATHRRMRSCLHSFFRDIRILDLHGSVRTADRALDGSPDENVFDIQQGVAIATLAAGPLDGARHVAYAELRGARAEKYRALNEAEVVFDRLADEQLARKACMFVPQDLQLSGEYEAFESLTDLFALTGQGIQTKQDAFALQGTEGEIRQVVQDTGSLSAQALSSKYGVPIETPSWSAAWAKKDVREHKGKFLRVLVAPFDWKWTYYTGHSNGFLARPRRDSTDMMMTGNTAIVAKRQTKETEFSSAFVVDCPVNEGLFSIDPKGRETLFPLRGAQVTLLHGPEGRPFNLAARGGATAEDFFQYLYALLYSRTYRTRYAGFLRVDFPRIPLPGTTGLLQDVAALGGELIGLHLMKSSKLDTVTPTYTGPTNPTVLRVGWSDGTVWLDAEGTKRGQPSQPGTVGFRGVPEVVWNFHIGGYQVCEKWLKDRKGKTLSEVDVAHYQRIVLALSETIRLMGEIDDVIEDHGGWPDAFQTGGGAR